MPKKKRADKAKANIIEAINGIRKSPSPYKFDAKKSVGKRMITMHQHERNNRDKSMSGVNMKNKTEGSEEAAVEAEPESRNRTQE